MIRTYKYLIYRLYTWRIEKKDDTPEATVIFLMSVVHLFQIGILALLLHKALPPVHLTKLQQYCVVIGFFLLYYLIVYSKKKWLSYIDEFKDETSAERKKGTLLVRLFTLGSIILFFAIAFIIIFLSGK